MTPIEEKRVFKRFQIHAPVRFQVRGESEANNTTSDNISSGGMSINSDHFVAPETNLTVEINILSRVLTTIARVAWASPVPHSNRHRLGLEFIEFSPIERNYLNDYLSIQPA